MPSVTLLSLRRRKHQLCVLHGALHVHTIQMTTSAFDCSGISLHVELQGLMRLTADKVFCTSAQHLQAFTHHAADSCAGC